MFMMSNNNKRAGIFISESAVLLHPRKGEVRILDMLERYKVKFFKQGTQEFPFSHLTFFFKENSEYPIPGDWRYPVEESDGYYFLSFTHPDDNPDFSRMPTFRRSIGERCPAFTRATTGIMFAMPKVRRT